MFHSATDCNVPIDLPYCFRGYKFIKLIGSGGTSIVALVEHTKTTRFFTAKVMSKFDLVDKDLLYSVEKEISLMRSFDHPNIIKFEETFEIKNVYGDEYVVVIMEYCKNGDLLTYAMEHGFTNEEEKSRIFGGILKAIQYLHKRGISHGDIKAENIVIDHNKNPKICDFGYSRTNTIGGDKDKNGTLYYAAPELFSRGEFDTLKTDIWAFGIMMHALFEKQFPYAQGNQRSIIKQIKAGKLIFNSHSDKKILSLVKKCTKFSPKDRPSIEEIMKDDFFNFIDFHPKQNFDECWTSSSSEDA